MGAFAAVSLMLAALGLYGVLAYAVRQRTQEIGIRMALGATATQVRVSVLRQAALILAVGLVVGIGGAMVLGRWLTTADLFEVSPSDPRIVLRDCGCAAHDHRLTRRVAARTACVESGTEDCDAAVIGVSRDLRI